MSTILDRYVQEHPASASRYEDARGLFPGGVTHDNRYMLPFPLYMTHGKGALKWDVDGNEYVDYVCGHGALIMGHSHPDINSVVADQVAKGTHLGANTVEEMRWAQAIKRLMPAMEKLRFHSSGTEATLMALRLARAYTGRTKFVKFEDHFHGWHDYVVASPGRPVAGVPDATAQSVVVLQPQISALEQLLARDGDIAAVILEPTGAHYGQLTLMVPQFLKDLRDVTKKYGAVLIMDEVVTGFRLSPGGAQGRFGIEPDLSTLAKIVAGGLPGGVVGGKAEIMDMMAFHDEPDWDGRQRVAHPGTFNANPLSAAAGAACLEMIANQPVNQRADAMAGRLKNGLNDILTRMEVPGHARGMASLIHLTLRNCGCDRELCTLPHREIQEAANPAVTISLRRAMLNAGVDMMGRGSFIVSSAHREQDVDGTLAAFEESLAAMRGEGIV